MQIGVDHQFNWIQIITVKILKPLETSGIFWLPEDPNNKQSGILKISEVGEAEIHITSLFDRPLKPKAKSPFGVKYPHEGTKTHDRVVGIIKTEKSHQNVTLEDCSYKYWSTPFIDGIANSIIRADFAYVGAGYDSKKDIRFSEIRFCVEGLDEWLGEYSTNVDYKYGENNELSNVRIDFSPLTKKNYSTSYDDMDVEINFSYTLPSGFDIVETKITQKAHISLKSPNLCSFDKFRPLLLKIQILLCFAIDQTVSLTSVIGYSSEITQELGNGKEFRLPIEIYYKSVPMSESKVEFNRYDMLLPFPVIIDQFDRILMQWLNSYGEFQQALDRYFLVMSGASRYVEIRFLLLIQGIEILHRQSSDQAEMDQEKFKKLIETVVNCVPEGRQDWLRSKLCFANKLSLRRRLKEMLEPFWDLYKTKINMNSFINSIVDTRNYLTHASSELESKSAKGIELYKLSQNLEALFQLHLLQLIGIRQENIEDLAKNHRSLVQKLDIAFTLN